MSSKRYEVKSSCPQCGCSYLTVLDENAIREKYGDDPRFQLECGECLAAFDTERKDACPEWDKECKLQEG